MRLSYNGYYMALPRPRWQFDSAKPLKEQSNTMKDVNKKIDLGLRIILSVILFAVPIVLAILVWSIPSTEVPNYITGLVTANVFLGIAEVIFLVRAAIFPKNGKRWWLEE